MFRTMPALSRRDCASILAAHGICEALEGCEIVSDEANAAKVIVCDARTDVGRYIVKLREEHYRSSDLIEAQSNFAHELSLSGLPTPRRYPNGDTWTSAMQLGDKRYYATVEKHVGVEGLSCFGIREAGRLGALLGRLHRTSVDRELRIGCSFLMTDMIEGRADLRRVFARYGGYAERATALELIFRVHDKLVRDLVGAIDSLPVSAVHGDIGASNNVALSEEKIWLFDFDNAGDEILLLDFFATWYGSVRCLLEAGKDLEDNSILYRSYLRGYYTFRSFTAVEHRCAPIASLLFRILHQCRYLLETTGHITDSVIQQINHCLSNNDIENASKKAYDTVDGNGGGCGQTAFPRNGSCKYY